MPRRHIAAKARREIMLTKRRTALERWSKDWSLLANIDNNMVPSGSYFDDMRDHVRRGTGRNQSVDFAKRTFCSVELFSPIVAEMLPHMYCGRVRDSLVSVHFWVNEKTMRSHQYEQQSVKRRSQ